MISWVFLFFSSVILLASLFAVGNAQYSALPCPLVGNLYRDSVDGNPVEIYFPSTDANTIVISTNDYLGIPISSVGTYEIQASSQFTFGLVLTLTCDATTKFECGNDSTTPFLTSWKFSSNCSSFFLQTTSDPCPLRANFFKTFTSFYKTTSNPDGCLLQGVWVPSSEEYEIQRSFNTTTIINNFQYLYFTPASTVVAAYFDGYNNINNNNSNGYSNSFITTQFDYLVKNSYDQDSVNQTIYVYDGCIQGSPFPSCTSNQYEFSVNQSDAYGNLNISANPYSQGNNKYSPSSGNGIYSTVLTDNCQVLTFAVQSEACNERLNAFASTFVRYQPPARNSTAYYYYYYYYAKPATKSFASLPSAGKDPIGQINLPTISFLDITIKTAPQNYLPSTFDTTFFISSSPRLLVSSAALIALSLLLPFLTLFG